MISSSNWRGPELVLFVLIQCTTLLSVLADGNNTIIAPTGGDILPVGMPYTIKWVPETAGPVKIVLQLDTGDIYPNITSSIPNIGQWTWYPADGLAALNNGSGYLIRICDLTDGSCTYTQGDKLSFSVPKSSSLSLCTVTSTVSSTPGTSFSTVTVTVSPSSASPIATDLVPQSINAKGLSVGGIIAVSVVIASLVTAGLVIGGYLLYRKGQHSRLAVQHKTQEPIETDGTPSTVGNTAREPPDTSHEQPTSAGARGLDDESDTE